MPNETLDRLSRWLLPKEAGSEAAVASHEEASKLIATVEYELENLRRDLAAVTPPSAKLSKVA